MYDLSISLLGIYIMKIKFGSRGTMVVKLFSVIYITIVERKGARVNKYKIDILRTHKGL